MADHSIWLRDWAENEPAHVRMRMLEIADVLESNVLKLNQIAVERDLARKERDSVSHRLGTITDLWLKFAGEPHKRQQDEYVTALNELIVGAVERPLLQSPPEGGCGSSAPPRKPDGLVTGPGK
jgi:hypothetical protein